jgi:hypothetical protein
MKDICKFYEHCAYFIAIWYILWSFGIFYGHLVYFVAFLVHFSRFGMLHQEKSGNPAYNAKNVPI